MNQLATEGGGFGPRSMGVPRAADNNSKIYVYDIDHRSNVCQAQVHIEELDAILVVDEPQCRVPTGATIASVTGGVVIGYDMYGQYITETVGAAGTSDTAFLTVLAAPADALWVSEYGLPYRYADDPAPPADVTYVAPANLNERGTFTWGGTYPATVVHNYTVDPVNMFGDTMANFASPDAIAADTFAATVDETGAIEITTTLVADSSTKVIFTFPDGKTVVADNGAGTVNYTLSPLWMSKYAAIIADNDSFLDTMIRAATNAGTHVIVDVTGSLVA